jgi:hypothetical protein
MILKAVDMKSVQNSCYKLNVIKNGHDGFTEL